MKKPIPIRIEESDIELASKLGISIPELVRDAIKREIALKTNKCPHCGQTKGDENESDADYTLTCRNDF